MQEQSSHSQVNDIKETANGKKRLALQFLEMATGGRIDEAYRKLIAPNGKHHNPYYPAGFPALQKGMKENEVQYPDLHLVVKHVIGEGDLVAVHSHVITKPGEPGMAVVHLFRFQGERIVEMWDCGQALPAESPNQDGMF